MNANRPVLHHWTIVAATASVLISVLLLIVLTEPSGAETASNAIRFTARVSVTLFLLAFSAQAAWQLWPGTFTKWQRQNRRYLGVSFALSHFVHLAAIFSLRSVAPEQFASIPALTWVLGGLAYVFIAAMTATSFDRTAQMIGPKGWKVLHTLGAHYIWLVFANSYVSRAITMPEYIVPATAVVGALLLRIVARLRRTKKEVVAVGAAG